MIDNVGQDEWFNLYLYLGSCWVNKSRYEARYSIRYRTQSPDLNRVLINWSSWNWERELDAKESRHESWAESSQFQNHLLKKDQFVDDLFNLHHLPDQPVLSNLLRRNLSDLSRRTPTRISLLWVFVAYGPTRIFQKSIVSSRIKVTKFL